MRTRTFRLTQAEANALHAAFLHMQDAETKTRFQAVRLYGLGYGVPQILDICGGSHSRLLEWVRAYREQGLTALLDHRKGGNSAKLAPHQIQKLREQLQTYTPAQLLGREHCIGPGAFWTVSDLALLVEREQGVVYQSKTSYYTLLAKCGFSQQCPAKQYKSHSDQNVMEFEELLEKKSSMSPKTLPTR
jgi:transposase